MAGSLITALLKPSPFKITDEKSNTVRWKNINVTKVEIGVEAVTTDIPFSTSDMTASAVAKENLQKDIASGKIIMPVRIRATFLIDEMSVVMSMVQLFHDVTHTLKVTSRQINSSYMAITEIDIKQTPEMLSAVRVDITFEQAADLIDDGFSPAKDGDKSSFGVSIDTENGLLNDAKSLYNKVSNFIGF